jgi:hypothetical protein
MKRKTLSVILLFCAFAPLFSQTKTAIYKAVDESVTDFAKDFIRRFPGSRKIAVNGFETDDQALMVHFIDIMKSALSDMSDGKIELYDRQGLENLQKELDFSLTGRVSENTEQRIGHFEGADTLIYGAMESSGRMSITAATTETGRILSHKTYDLSGGARLWSIGVSAGSSFSRPLFIGTAHGTIAPLRYSFLEIGVDLGVLSRKQDENYFSVIPYAHYAFFLPFDKGGLYAGAGIGYMFGNISNKVEEIDDPISIITADGIVGVNLFNFLDVSYTLRTTFKAVTNKFSAGIIYRFK